MFTSKLPPSAAAARASLLHRKGQEVDAAGSKAVGEMLQYIAEVEGRVKAAVEDSARRTEKLKAEEHAQRAILASLKREIVLVQEQRRKEADELDRVVQHAAVERDKLREELASLQEKVHHEREEAEKVSIESRQVRQEWEQHVQSYQLQAKQLAEDVRQLAALKKNAEMDLLLVERLLCEATRTVMAAEKDVVAPSQARPRTPVQMVDKAAHEEEEVDTVDMLVCTKVTELAEELQETGSLVSRYLSSIKQQQQQQRATLYKMEEKAVAKREELTSLQFELVHMKEELTACALEQEEGRQICSTLKEDAVCLQQVRGHLLAEVQELLLQRQQLLMDNEAMSREALCNVEQVVFQALHKSFSYREVFVEMEEVKHSLLEAVRTLAEQKQDVEQEYLDTEATLAAKQNILMTHHDFLSAQDEKLARAIEQAKDKECEVMRFVHDLDKQMRDAQALAIAEAIQEAKLRAPAHE